MNDFDELPPDDEDLDAVLEGDATPTQRARVLGDPALRRALDVRRQLRDELADAPLLPEALARRTLQAALAAFDEDALAAASADDDGSPGAVPDLRAVTPLAPPATGRPRRMPSVAWLGAAAAVLALVAGGAAALSDRDADSDESAATLSLEAAAAGTTVVGGEASRDAAASAAAGSSEAATTTAAAAPTLMSAVPDLGELDDPAAVRAAVAAAKVVPPSSPSSETTLTDDGVGGADASPCESAALAGSTPGSSATVVARTTYRDTPAMVVAIRAPGDTSANSLVVVADGSCASLARVPLT